MFGIPFCFVLFCFFRGRNFWKFFFLLFFSLWVTFIDLSHTHFRKAKRNTCCQKDRFEDYNILYSFGILRKLQLPLLEKLLCNTLELWNLVTILQIWKLENFATSFTNLKPLKLCNIFETTLKDCSLFIVDRWLLIVHCQSLSFKKKKNSDDCRSFIVNRCRSRKKILTVVVGSLLLVCSPKKKKKNSD